MLVAQLVSFSSMVGCSPLPHPVSLRRIIVSGLNAEKEQSIFLTNSKTERSQEEEEALDQSVRTAGSLQNVFS